MRDDLQVFIGQRIERSESGCWMWTRSRQAQGYGDFRYQGKHYTAHRAAYEAFTGPIPAGMHVLHRCDVRACCNPEHLFLGTNRDNIADSVAKGRRKGITRRRPSGLTYVYTTKRPGPPPKLPVEAQTEIVRQARAGQSYTALARQYAVAWATIRRVVNAHA